MVEKSSNMIRAHVTIYFVWINHRIEFTHRFIDQESIQLSARLFKEFPSLWKSKQFELYIATTQPSSISCNTKVVVVDSAVIMFLKSTGLNNFVNIQRDIDGRITPGLRVIRDIRWPLNSTWLGGRCGFKNLLVFKLAAWVKMLATSMRKDRKEFI